jgi:hypothetical protein
MDIANAERKCSDTMSLHEHFTMSSTTPVHHAARASTIVIVASVVLAAVTNSCDHYDKRKAMRDRRMEYLQHMSDSARTAHDQRGDSLRRAQDSAMRRAGKK